jgi:hypothetical protein
VLAHWRPAAAARPCQIPVRGYTSTQMQTAAALTGRHCRQETTYCSRRLIWQQGPGAVPQSKSEMHLPYMLCPWWHFCLGHCCSQLSTDNPKQQQRPGTPSPANSI